jgi:hypothetical protein
MKYARSSRGQALYETTIAMPLFLVGMFGVMWAMKQSSLSERVQLATRYGGMVASLAQPYEQFSLLSMYATIDNAPPSIRSTCYDGANSSVQAQLTGPAPASPLPSFWLPAASPAPASLLASPCTSQIAVITTSGTETYSQTVLLRNNYSSISAAAPVNGFISSAALKGSSATSVRAAQNFFRSPDVPTILLCTNVAGSLGPAVKNGLEAMNDTTTTTAVPTPMPTTVPATGIVSATTLATCANTSTFAAPTAPY